MTEITATDVVATSLSAISPVFRIRCECGYAVHIQPDSWLDHQKSPACDECGIRWVQVEITAYGERPLTPTPESCILGDEA